jgi:hypothetical protein
MTRRKTSHKLEQRFHEKDNETTLFVEKKFSPLFRSNSIAISMHEYMLNGSHQCRKASFTML